MDYTDGFRVATLDGSLESQELVSIAEKVFYDLDLDIFGNTKLEKLIQLESLADSTKPNYLRIPDDATRIKESRVMYDVSDDVTKITMSQMVYMTTSEFLDRISNVPTEDNTQTVTDFGGYKMKIYNDRAPQFFTSFDDEHLVFDAFDLEVESTLQQSKNGIITSQSSSFVPSDSYIIDFPEWFHVTFLNEFMAEASIAIREEPLPRIEKKAKAGIVKARLKQRVGKRTRTINYGRKSNGRTNRTR